MSMEIRKQNSGNREKIKLNNVLWGYNEYTPEVYVELVYNEKCFFVEFTVMESDPKREKNEHFQFVHEDSCVEFFANFDPENSNKYINFEVNANGVMNVGFRSDRYDSVPLKTEEIEGLGIKPEIFDDYWTVSYRIDYDFIRKYYPEFDIDKCKYILGNFYKCGDMTFAKHYLSMFEVKCENPDYHRPEYFDKIHLV